MLGIREASSFALDLFFPQKQYGRYLKLVLSKSIALTPTNNPATELEILLIEHGYGCTDHSAAILHAQKQTC
jgi:hypothetical protein